MSLQPLVSVLMPVFNVEKYLAEAIASICNQTYKNIEIIIIDDGSTDGSFRIASEFALTDDRIKLYKNEINLGIVKTLNKALLLSTGEYLIRMDGDDISAQDRIQVKLEFLNNNKEVDLVGCSMIAIDEHGLIINKIKKIRNFNLIKKTARYTSPVSHIWMCKKHVYKELNGYRSLDGAEDYDFILRLISTGMKCENIDNYFGYYVRLGRSGNTVGINGIRQKKLHEYIYKMHRRRLAGKCDGYIPEYQPKYFNLSKYLYYIANKNFYNAKINFKKGRYFFATLKLFQSLFSPHMVHIYYLRIMYRYRVWQNNEIL